MNKIFASAIMAVAMLGSVSEAEACTNFIVGKKALKKLKKELKIEKSLI